MGRFPVVPKVREVSTAGILAAWGCEGLRADHFREEVWGETQMGDHDRDRDVADYDAAPFVSQREIATLTWRELVQAAANALTVHQRDCRDVLVREIRGRLNGKIPRD